MLAYNFAGEFAMFVILSVTGYSFLTNYKQRTLLNRIVKGSYIFAILSIVLSFLRGVVNNGYVLGESVVLGYVINTLYFALIPSFISGYLVFYTIISTKNIMVKDIRKKLVHSTLPHIIYTVILFVQIRNGNVFSFTVTEGYVRGEWFQLPYYFATVLIFLIMIDVLLRKSHNMNRNTVLVILGSLVVQLVGLFLQFVFPNMIIPVMMNVMCVLAVHMYLQNNRKSVHTVTGANNFLTLQYNMEVLIQKETDFSLYILKIRELKRLNERNGLEYGDKLLQVINYKLLEHLDYEQVYVYKGDAFALLLEKTSVHEKVVDTILEKLRKPLLVEDQLVSIRLACARVDNKIFGSTVDELLSAAEYSISILSETHCEMDYLYDTKVVKELIEKSKMIQKMKYAIDHRMFEMYYQPMYSAKSGTFTQAEALVRMKEEDGSIIFPSAFIDLAETTDLIIPMTYVVLDIVCEDLRKLMDQFGEELLLEAISVNFPYGIFLNPKMNDNVKEIMDKYGLSTDRVKIEITERTLIADNHSMTNMMEKMLGDGFVFELDDFGVDYSNINTLLELPLDIIKIDRSVLLSAMMSESNQKFFKHLTAGISATGRTIIVEGVEEKDQLDFVLDSNCQYVQGYFFSKPLDYQAFMEFILPKNQKKLLGQVF
ncbi:MAG: EAL domain-containing protein [Eubacteriales bacterium]